ncbi:hypothetical protein AAMO2058_001570400 [Amorphochlora amoebiformis]
MISESMCRKDSESAPTSPSAGDESKSLRASISNDEEDIESPQQDHLSTVIRRLSDMLANGEISRDDYDRKVAAMRYVHSNENDESLGVRKEVLIDTLNDDK